VIGFSVTRVDDAYKIWIFCLDEPEELFPLDGMEKYDIKEV
jgi:hypothetical protein